MQDISVVDDSCRRFVQEVEKFDHIIGGCSVHMELDMKYSLLNEKNAVPCFLHVVSCVLRKMKKKVYCTGINPF